MNASAAPASGELVTGTGYTFRLPEGWHHGGSSVVLTNERDPTVDVTVDGPSGDGVLILTVTIGPPSAATGTATTPSSSYVQQFAVHSDEPYVLAGRPARAITASYSVGAQRLVVRDIQCVHNGLELIVSFTTEGSDPGPGLEAFDEILASWTWTTA
jgi:hypothetical protein